MMRRGNNLLGRLATHRAANLRTPWRSRSLLPLQRRHQLFTKTTKHVAEVRKGSAWPVTLFTGGLFMWWLYPTEDFAQLSCSHVDKKRRQGSESSQQVPTDRLITEDESTEETSWSYFTSQFERLSVITDMEWVAFSDKIVDSILPDWSKLIPVYVKKLQQELSVAEGSLADEIWQEAHDPFVNPEIRYSAYVRVSTELCDEEKAYLKRRRVATRSAIAAYLGLEENDVHPDDVPTIAVCGSGGGLRALIAGTGSLLATEADGLFDCVTYTAGVSGSCWLQMLYLGSFSKGSLGGLLSHLKSRASTHIAYPPVAFESLVSLPTSKYLLSGLVEKLRGDSKADFGLVDIYGLLLGARFLVPRGELGVDSRDFKISSQRAHMKHGQLPMPIYTAVRHEIPNTEQADSEEQMTIPYQSKREVSKEAYFQWFEITPYEVFCEEFGAGIPTWSLGRKFKDGKDVPPEDGFHLPEIRTPLLMGIFGSAFCATLSHYYREIRPIIKTITGFDTVDNMVSGRDDDLRKVHPIDPATIPNFTYQMYGKLAKTTPDSVLEQEYIQLMDAGMSNNLPIYPLLRPGRDVDVLVAFDASADIKTDDWLSVADGYARQRGIKGWPVGIGWPKSGEPISQTTKQLDDAQAESVRDAEMKVQEAKAHQESLRKAADKNGGDAEHDKPDSETKFEPGDKTAGDLGYCTVWVGSTQERSSDPPPPSKAIGGSDTWQLMEPDAGLTVIYLPFLSNDKIPDISPGTTDFLSTWNFIYTPEQIDSVVKLARANYDEGKEQIKSTVRAIYERKKKLREQAEAQRQRDKYGAIARRGEVALLKQGDLFS